MPTSPDEGGGTPHYWGCRALREDGSASTYSVVHSPRRAERDRIALPEAEAAALVGADAISVAHFTADGQVRAIEVSPHVAPKAPPLWFAELHEPDAAPPAVSLVAFVGHDVAPGTVLGRVALRQVAVTSADQVAAVRMYPATGEIDQVYVSPASRGRHIASALLIVAATLAGARDWGNVWADGQRTADGERLAQARPEWSHRVTAQTHLLPPMTPLDQR